MNDSNKNYTVYMHKNKINSKVYIGITCQSVSKRWGSGGNGYFATGHFGKAIRKYGWDNFEHIIIYENLSQKEACEKEIELINKYKAQNPEFGYNIQLGGNTSNLGIKFSDETCKQMSIRNSGEGNPFYGKHHSKESKIKISNSRKGVMTGEQHFMYGKHLPMETRQKLSESHIGKNVGGSNGWATKVYCLTDGQVYDSLADAERKYNITSLCSALSKHTYTAGKNDEGSWLHWIYYDEYINMTEEDLINLKMELDYKKDFRVICLNDKTIYDSPKVAANTTGFPVGGIRKVCVGLNRSCGKTVNGEPIYWMYYKDYIKEYGEIA